jgi:hypothetical protein
MKSKQVLSIEQMKHLQELGLDTSDASMCVEWRESDESKKVVTSLDADTYYDYYHETYTLQDILDKLPHYLNPFPSKQILFAWMIERDTIAYRNVEDIDDCLKHFTDDLLINAAYEMLCWCIENGYVGKEGG